MKVFEIKSCEELTWDDIPFVEAPVFAQYHIMDMLMDPRQLWMRIQRIQEFITKEIGVYRPLENHNVVKDHINYLIGSGIYFNVSLTGKPFSAAFDWQSDESHPHKGFWKDKHNFYWMSPRIVQHHLDRIALEWHRKQNTVEEDSLSLLDGVVAYAADQFTAKGMKSGYALSSPEQLKYISPVTEKSVSEQVNYFGIVDDSLIEVGLDYAQAMCHPTSTPRSPYKDVLDLITKGEGGYNSMNNGTRNNKIIQSTHNASRYLGSDLTEMSLDKIMSMQQGTINTGRKIFAAGRYQMIPSTLKSVVQSSGLDASNNFTPQVQDQLAIQLIEKRRPLADYLNGNHNDVNAAMLSMSKEWASIPNPTTGNSYYGDGNKSMHTVDEVKQVLISTKNALARIK